MGRTGFILGLLTAVVCACALFLHPLPGAPLGGDLARLTAATYRMAGDVRRNTCPTEPHWPARWHVDTDALTIGRRALLGRRLRAAVVFEATRLSDDGCLRADWRIKLAPRGEGIAGTASWELASSGGAACPAPAALPCLVEADVYGLPEPAPSQR